MLIYLLRHGKTAGNLKGRYIGTTDEPLCEEFQKELKEQSGRYTADILYVSPMKRCVQTAQILFPGQKQHLVLDFRECDFGAFENKNYQELSGDARYQAWIDSGGTLPFPKGESREAFQKRCVAAFCKILTEAQKQNAKTIACVVHGGTIMSILEKMAYPRRNYYDYQVKNGCGYAVTPEADGSLRIQEKTTLDFSDSQAYNNNGKMN